MASDTLGPDREGGIIARLAGWLRGLWSSDASHDNVEELVRTYANSIYVTARGLSLAQGDEYDAIATRLAEEVAKERPDSREILALELQLVRALPSEIRQRRLWELRARFEKIATSAERDAYLASLPKSPTDGVPAGQADLLLADHVVLLEHVHKHQLMTVLREQAVRSLKQWVQNGLWRSLLIFSVVAATIMLLGEYARFPEPAQYFLIGLILIYSLGRVGAAMSVVQRLQHAVRGDGGDAFYEVTALCTGRRGISIAMMSGGIFALLLYVLFSAGLGQNLGLSGGIFPRVGDRSPADLRLNEAAPTTAAQPADPTAASAMDLGAQSPRAPGGAPRDAPATDPETAVPTHCDLNRNSCMPPQVSQIGVHLGFQEYPDFLKMLVLAFLAGFAERLVPDAIDRLIQRRQIGRTTLAAEPRASA